MKKIEKLTAEQEAQLSVYRDKYLAIGLSTITNKEASKRIIDDVYRVAGLEPPRIKIWLESPFKGAIGAAMLEHLKTLSGDQVGNQVWNQVWDQVGNQVGNQVWDQVWDQVGNQVGNQVWDQVGNQVWNQVGNQVWNQVGNQVGNQVWNQVGNQVENQVGNQVGNQVENQVGNQVGNQVWNQVGRAGYGSHDAAWLGFYSYFKNVCGLEACDKLVPLTQLSEVCGWFWPFENAVILTEKPLEIHMRNKRLHRDGGPAIRYSDNYSIYALNGVNVTQEIAETPANKLSSDLILKERNAQVRAEIVRKIGIERVVKDLGAVVIDTWKDYELLLLDLKDGRHRPYLKMKNQSVPGLLHIEGVPPEIKTVKKALAWRNGMEMFVEPVILT